MARSRLNSFAAFHTVELRYQVHNVLHIIAYSSTGPGMTDTKDSPNITYYRYNVRFYLPMIVHREATRLYFVTHDAAG